MPLTLTKRMEIVEQKVAALEVLPERMTLLERQFLQLRVEMRVEFSAVRAEISAADEETRRTLAQEIRVGNEETRRLLRDGDEETRRLLREADE